MEKLLGGTALALMLAVGSIAAAPAANAADHGHGGGGGAHAAFHSGGYHGGGYHGGGYRGGYYGHGGSRIFIGGGFGFGPWYGYPYYDPYYYAPPLAYAPPVAYSVPPADYDAPAYGTVQPTQVAEGYDRSYCREYQNSVAVGGAPQTVYGVACRQPDGTWRIVQ